MHICAARHGRGARTIIGPAEAWSPEQLRRVATMYYVAEETMDAIAARTRVSRSTVSRQLAAARERGIVTITVQPVRDTGGLGSALAEQFGIEAHVVPVRENASDAHRLEQVARMAGRLLSGWFDNDMVLGVAWGTTVSAVLDHLVPRPTRGSVVVQLNGAVHAASDEVSYVSDLLGRAGQAFEARTVFFPVPAFFDDPRTKAALWRERSIAGVVDLQRRCSIALFGVGSWVGPITSQVYAGGYLDDIDMAGLKKAGAVGDICTTFVRADGTWRDLDINRRSSGPDLAQLAALPRRVAVVAAAGRVPGTLGALRAGAISDLVIDEHTAEVLMTAAARPVRSTRRR